MSRPLPVALAFASYLLAVQGDALFALQDNDAEVRFGLDGDSFVRREVEGDLSIRAAIDNDVVIKSPLEFRIKTLSRSDVDSDPGMCNSLGDRGKTIIVREEESDDELCVCLWQGNEFKWVKIGGQSGRERLPYPFVVEGGGDYPLLFVEGGGQES
mmetsp:Transcript_15906/g.42815  ORF Transcript_15906/g.42815 Transcript_15906/m.42815 type:complete len:156 (+) Transcript_15906:38-505(+)